MHYTDYQNARDAAWKILIDLAISELPVAVTKVCSRLDIPVRSYQDAEAAIQTPGLGEHTRYTDGFTVFLVENPVIFYDGGALRTRARFTIAHELGHILLGHVKLG